MNLLTDSGSSSLRATFASLGKTYNVTDIANGFRPNESHIVKLFNNGFEEITEDEDHPLTEINVITCEDRDGVAFLFSDGSPSTSRTNTDANDREPNSLFDSPSTYKMVETQTDIFIPYALISKWALGAKSKSNSKAQRQTFQNNYTFFIHKRICLDALNIGFNGTSVAAEATAKRYLTDVNKGWTQVVKEQKPEQVIETAITIGIEKEATFKNLDQVVSDLVDTSIEEELQGDLICIISSNLISEEKQRLYSSENFTKEKKETADTFKIFGGLPRVRIPSFPDNTIVVTSLSNLSIYIKDNTLYRQVAMNAKRNRVEDYQQREEAYIVENLSKYAALTNVKSYEAPA